MKQYKAAAVAPPAAAAWQLAPYLTDFYLGGSDAQALGGNLAYQYGKNGSLDQITDTAMRLQLSDTQFGVAAQYLVNQAPTVANALSDFNALEEQAFSFTVPANAFNDVDFIHGDSLSYSATLADGSILPSWLVFDAATGTFTGAPANGDAGTFSVKVAATDTGGLSASDTFDIFVQSLTVAGTADADTLVGSIGNDTISGLDGNDSLTGLAGNDFLDGGLGTDSMQGVSGNDTYVVDNAGDMVTENANEGIDLVQSSVNYTLAANVENLTLTGTAAINGTGNSLGNTLTGNSGANLLNGGTGADTLIGGLGNDTYVVDNANDVVTENASEGTDLVRSSISYVLGANLENLTLTGAAAINGTGNDLNNALTGNSGANVLTGGSGNDTLNGGAGADTLIGGLGNDTYVVDNANDVVTENASEGTDLVQSSISYVLGANLENLTLTGTAAINGSGNDLNNALTGNSGANMLTGGDGNDTLNGGVGADTLIGSLGNDTYVVDNAGDVVTESANEGTDLVQSSVTYTLSTDVENLTLTGTAAISGTGNELDNVLTGNTGANTLAGGEGHDTLNGGTGTDTLIGGLGNDIYVVDNAGDVVIENADEGIDQVQSSVTYTLSTDVENLTLTGTAAISGTGNELDNVLTGNSGANTLNGGAGADTLVGGLGNDTYVIDNVNDAVTENASEGTDTVQSSVTYTLAANIEKLALMDTTDINGTGNALANTLTGNSGANILDGDAGADILIGGLGDDIYVVDNAGDKVTENASEGTDRVQSSVTYTLAANAENLALTGTATINGTGNALDNVLSGNSAANTLNGGTGADTLIGGLGNDTYVADNAGDVVTENADEGTDLVQSSVTYTLASDVENLTLTGTAAISGTGNELDNILTGNSGVNTLAGGDGNDTLNGGTGADILIGGLGNDTYVVDNANDVVTENASEGTDLVQSSVTYTLAADAENLTLTGTAAIKGAGNELDNVLTGNSGANTLNGGMGADTLIGGLGNDTYVVDNAGDVVTENASEGTDTVQSSISYVLGANLENLTLTGTAAINGTGNDLNNALTGNSGANTLTGGSGNDTINGGAGADILIGGLGNDTYTVDNIGDVVTENANEGIDLVQCSVTYTLASNLENLTLAGSGAINGTDNALDNLLTGNSGANKLTAGVGIDILQGGGGNDVLKDAGDNNLLNGGAGTDTLTGASGNELFMGGTGNDTITTGSGYDVIAFNRGDGVDTVAASTGADNTLSLGGGIRNQDMVFHKSGNDLILDTGAGESISFQNWYASSSNRSVVTLQMIEEASADFAPGGSDPLLDNKIERFDFAGLVGQFDQALTSNPALTAWTLNDALAQFALGGSDTDALGGDLAYQYGRYSNLANVGLGAAQGLLGSAQFGVATQALQNPATLGQDATRLS